MHGGGGHWKAQLRAQWESTRRRANAGAQTDALYADAGAQTTRPAYTDGGAQTLLGADDEDARPAPSYASDDEADARLAARIVAPAPAKLVLVAKAQQEHSPTVTELAAPTLDAADSKSASARPRPPRSGAPPQTPAAASGAPGPGTTKGVSHSVHTARSPPPPYAPPASPLRLPPPSASHSASGSASSPSRSRKPMSPPVPKSPALPVHVPVSPSAPAAEAPQRERLFIRIPARKRPVPAPAPALEPQTPVEQQLASPTLVLSPPAPAPPEAVAVSGRKRPRARPLEEASPAKRALSASNGHSVQVSEPVAGPSRLAAPNGEHVAVESVRAKRQTKTAKSRVAPLPPPAPTAAVSSYAKVTAPARARQWPSLSSAVLPTAPSSVSEDASEPPGPTLSVAEALAAPPVEQAPSVPVVEQARPLVPRKRTRSPSATAVERATALPRREGTTTGAHAVAESPVAATAHTEAEHEQIRSRTPPGLSDADLEVYRELERDVREMWEGAWGPRLAAALQAKIAEGPEQRAEGLEQRAEGLEQRAEGPGQRAKGRDQADAQAAAGPSTVRTPADDAPAAVARMTSDSMQPAAHPPPINEHAPKATSPKRAPTSVAPASAPAAQSSSSPARPKITLRLKLPRAPSPPPAKSPVRDKTESPIGMCFPSPPAPAAPALSRGVPPELLAAFGGPGEEDEEDAPVVEAAHAEKGTPSPPDPARNAVDDGVEESVGPSFTHASRADVRQEDAPAPVRNRSPESTPSRAVSPLPLLLDPAVLADAHARPAEEDVLRESAPRPASAVGFQGGADGGMGVNLETTDDGPPAHTVSARAPSLDPLVRADLPDPVAALSSQDAEDEDAAMNMLDEDGPALPSAATPPRAPSLADSPEALSVASPEAAEAMDMNMNMAEDDAPAPPPAVPRKRVRTPSLEQRALSSPRRSSTPASPLPLPSPPPQPQRSPSPPPPQALRSSPQPDPSPKSGPMSPPWSPVALPDEMMQLLTLGGEPLPMPVFDPLPPPPPPDEEDEFNSGVEDEVERMLEVAPQAEEKPAKKRKRRASAKRKSRALVGDSD